MRLLPLAVAVGSVAALALVPRTAHAFEVVEVGVGPMVSLGANFIAKPSDAAGTPYGGFSGFSGGGGAAIDIRVLKFVGLEVDILRKTDRGKADITTTDNNTHQSTTFSLDIGQSATHVPLLLKAVLPTPLISPNIFVGPEFVFPSDGTATTSVPVTGPAPQAHADKYTALTAGIGFEIKLPLPIVDIRLPFSLRYSHFGLSDHVADRVSGAANGATIFDSRWQHAVNANLAAQIWF